MRVFVTGSSSRFARALLPRLCADPAVEQVTGIDIAPPFYEHPRFTASRLDVRSAALERAMSKCDALVHLAFVVLRGKMSASEMFDTNVNGSRAVFRAARRTDIARIVHMSSAAVYGAGTLLDESAAVNPPPNFLYAQHKAQLETLLETEFPDCVRLRPHVILGPHAQPLLKWLIRQPCYIRTGQPYPLLQCVHEEDVANAVLLALKSRSRGAFNLAAGESFSFREIIVKRHRVSMPLPLTIARAGLYAAWGLSGWGGELGWLDGLTRSLTLDCRRVMVELGWRSSYSAWQAIAQT